MARWTAERGWPLFKIRPKCHLFGHILLLGIFSIPRFKGLGFRVVLIKLKNGLQPLGEIWRHKSNVQLPMIPCHNTASMLFVT